MKKNKPDIFLGITMFMLVLAALLCILILNAQKNKNETLSTEPSKTETTEATGGIGMHWPSVPSTSEPEPSTEAPQPTEELRPIKSVPLQADLDESLSGLNSEWQVMVIDPIVGTEISSAVNCGVDDWMTANRMTQVFIMGTVFQQVQDGTLVLDDVMDDLKAMIAGDEFAADRLTAKVGGGNDEMGREVVKSFASSNGLKLGFNRSNSAGSQKNYVTAQQTAQILSLICGGKLVSEDASMKMLEILLTPVDGLEIETGITGEGIQYGFITDIEEDVCICAMGVVKTPKRSFVISIVCNNPVTTAGAKNKVTELISTVVPYFD